MDTAVTDQLLSTTRAVRRRLDLERPVEHDVILECLRLAVQAPTGGNQQAWRWLVVDDPEVRAGVADIYARRTLATIDRRYPHIQDPQTRRVHDSARYLATVLAKVPVLIVPCVQGRIDEPRSGHPAAFYGSIFPAIWNLQLALRSRRMGSVLTTPFVGSDERRYTEILQLPDTMTPVALLPVAYTIGDEFKPAERPPIETITRWNRWTD
ncbi:MULTISPECIES: nitroreductase family protein [Thermomonosporaceae]|uniref:nitroreductase family protein n=1 Tax=Thermomonosporaceae TaxID=2012 RepID=UPI00255AF60E|nr:MULTISPECIES: nitroreductase family protein [Thermomonosporaceae]MDL4775255.1 nitroreductase family protein [Actinomadura xylanilytica]